MDSTEEQELLETIVDEVKPARPRGAGFARLHYLLFTPFRHPPLDNGSRFGGRDERSLFYGAKSVESALAERSYYQLVFFAGTAAPLAASPISWTAFAAEISTDKGIDLTTGPFRDFRDRISSPTQYADSQSLGRRMRAFGIEAFTYQSARCPRQGTNVALFEPVFKHTTPKNSQTWQCLVVGDACELIAVNTTPVIRHRFTRASFEIEGKLPAPAV